MAPKVLVVCLGNICRSPMGEAVLRHVAKERNIDLIVDSAGTAAYHVGEEPDERSVPYTLRAFRLQTLMLNLRVQQYYCHL